MEFKSLEELEDELKKGVFRPVYLFTGPEDYLRRLAEELLLSRTLPPESQAFNFSEFSVESHPVDEVLKAADTFPLASPYRLVILRDVDSLAREHEDALVDYLKRPSTKTILVLVAGSLDRRTSFYRLLKEKHCVVDFQSPKPAAFERWADHLFRKKGYRISQESLRKLIELAGSDFQTLLGEIEKLTLYAGSDKAIPDSALEDLVRESREHDSFELTEAMGRRDAKAALRLLANLLEAGEAPLKIVGAIVWNFRNLLMVQELLDLGKNSGQISSVLHLHPYALEKLLRQARTLENRTVRRLYDRLAALDLKLKSSGNDERLLLENLICSL